jgi:DNA-binding transcriptional ArsR family regulator
MKKTDSFAESTEKLASLSKAIGHPARIQILLFLMESGPSTCQDVVDKLPYSQSTVSGHLQKLKEDGYINLKYQKTSSIYTIQKDTLFELNKLIQTVFKLLPDKPQLSLF